MKKILVFFMLCATTMAFSQNNYIVKTEDGRRVLLKADFTWEYIDAVKKETTATTHVKPKKNSCNLPLDFKEPKLNNKIQAQLKKGRATIKHAKKKVAKDYNCAVEDVTLITISEKKESAHYTFCANGTKVFYKRTGLNIIEKGKFF